jgi:hypothetical protein
VTYDTTVLTLSATYGGSLTAGLHTARRVTRLRMTWACLLIAGLGPAAAAAGRQRCRGYCGHDMAAGRCRGACSALNACPGGPLEPAHARQVRDLQIPLTLGGHGTRLCGCTPPCLSGCTARILCKAMVDQLRDSDCRYGLDTSQFSYTPPAQPAGGAAPATSPSAAAQEGQQQGSRCSIM